MNMKYKTLLVDGPYLAHKTFSAPYRLSTPENLDATMIHGFIRTLNARRKQFNPDQIIIAWESHGTPSWRRDLYPLYKPGKKANKQFINEQEDLKILLNLLKVKQYYSPTNEADDVIAKLATNKELKPTLIYSTDKDLMQLIGPDCHMYRNKEIFDSNKVKDTFDVWPEQIPDYLSIVGDDADNIIGVKGFGPKKTAELLKDVELDEMLMMNYKGGSLLDEYKTKIFFNKRLIILNYSCKLEEVKVATDHTVETLLDKYKLNSLKQKLDEYKLLGDQE